jgi:glycosyltransferase involved in cell wall biosynthesis
MKDATGVIVASDHLRELVVAHGVPAERVFKVPLFVREAVAAKSPSQRFEAKRLMFVGRITHLKGWPEMLEAFRRFLGQHPGWRLEIAGEGMDLDALRSQAADLGLPVTLHPWQDDKGRDSLLDASTLLVLPSTWPEPFGIVGLEAGRLGVPTVTFGTGGIREWFSPGVNGEMADRLDAQSLADALARAVSSMSHYEALARGARDTAARHGPERHVTMLTEVLASLAKRRETRMDGVAPS